MYKSLFIFRGTITREGKKSHFKSGFKCVRVNETQIEYICWEIFMTNMLRHDTENARELIHLHLFVLGEIILLLSCRVLCKIIQKVVKKVLC